jgi:hypothetical protein
MATTTKTTKAFKVDGNVRSKRIIPIEDSKGSSCSSKHSSNWKGNTVAVYLDKKEAIHLATVLPMAATEWDTIAITAWRYQKRRSDGTYPITVTSDIQVRKESA